MNWVLRFTRVLLVFSALFSLSHAAEEIDVAKQGALAATVPVPEGLNREQIQKAILLAGSGRGWTATERKDGRVVLFLEQRGWRSTMTLLYDTSKIDIYSNSGKVDRNGMIKKQEIPSWLNFLKQDITKQLGMAAYNK